MTKFKNKKTKKIVEADLNYYINQLRNNLDYEEVKEIKEPSLKETKKEVDNKPL